MARLSVLITNAVLAGRSGTEVVAFETARGLAARGHAVALYAPVLGPLAAEARGCDLRVLDSLEALARPPEVIHGHHNGPTATAIARFPGTPAVFFCHDAVTWHDAPPALPSIRRIAAVDLACRERLVVEHGIPESEVAVLPNAVDVARIAARPPLPPRPARALAVAKITGHLPMIRAACARLGLALDEVGPAIGRPVADLAAMMADYDLVFASGRTALEGLAVGTAVVICHGTRLGGLITGARFARWRSYNFGWKAMDRPLGVEPMVEEIRAYDAADAAALCHRVRAQCDLESHLDRLTALYEAAIADFARAPPSAEEHCASLAAFMAQWLPSYESQWPWQKERDLLRHEIDQLTAQLGPPPRAAWRGALRWLSRRRKSQE